MTPRSPARLFWPLASILVLADCSSKRVIEATVSPPGTSVPVVSDVLRFTLAYNPGAAFSMRFGPYQRWVLIGLACLILYTLARAYRSVTRTGTLGTAGLACVVGGAVGNLLDRLISNRGVVDFIDVGLNGSRFYVFNLADAFISVGAMLLAFALWREEFAPTPARPADA